MYERIIRTVKRYDIWLLTAAALLIRLFAFSSPGNLAYGEFFRDYFTVSQLIHGQMIVLLGPPSILGGFHFGPFYYYWMAPFALLAGGSAYGLVLCSAVTSALSVYAIFRLLLLWSGKRDLALLGALLTTFSMYSVYLGSYVSNPNFLPLFVIWFLYCLTKSVQGNASMFDAVGLGLSFGFATELHVTALVVLGVVAVASYALHRPGFSLKKISVALVAFFVSYIPYLWYEFTHSWTDFTRLGQLGTAQVGGSAVHVHVAEDPISSIHNWHAVWSFFSAAWLPITNVNYEFTVLRPSWLNIIVALAGVIFLGYFLRALVQKKSSRDTAQSSSSAPISKEAFTILLTWIVTAVVMLLLYRHVARYYYAIVLWPAPIVLLVYASEWMREHFNIGHALAVLFIAFGIVQIISFEAVPHHFSWKNFYQEYEASYVHDPNILKIGSPGYTSGNA